MSISAKSEGKFNKHHQSWNKMLQKNKELFCKLWSETINDIGSLAEFTLGKSVGCGAFGNVVIVSVLPFSRSVYDNGSNSQTYLYNLI